MNVAPISPAESLYHHGDARRPTYPFGFDSVDDPPKAPLHIIRSGVSIPSVFYPSGGRLVVSSAIKQRIDSVTNVLFKEVMFEKLVDFLVLRDGRTKPDLVTSATGTNTLAAQFAALPDVAAFHEGLAPYYEIIPSHIHELTSKFGAEADSVQVDLTPDDPLDEPYRHFTLELSSEMFDRYPVLLANLVWFCTAEVFEFLEPAVEWRYFARGEVDLPR